MSRNKARLVAMQALFQLDADPEMMERVVRARSVEEELLTKDVDYITNVINRVVRDQKEVDGIIREYAIDWDVHRLAKVERAILRLAVGEILFTEDVPVSVAINEAVRLAKKYGADNAAKFVNGILGKLSRSERIPEGKKQDAGKATVVVEEAEG